MNSLKTWLFGHSHRRMHLRRAPMRQLAELLTGVFLLFWVIGFSSDMMDGGTLPWSLALLYAVTTGLNAAIWVFVLARMQMWVAVLLAIGQFFLGNLNGVLRHLLIAALHPAPMEQRAGLRFAGMGTLFTVVVWRMVLLAGNNPIPDSILIRYRNAISTMRGMTLWPVRM